MGREFSCLGNQEANSQGELTCYALGTVLFTSLQRAQPLLPSPSHMEPAWYISTSHMVRLGNPSNSHKALPAIGSHPFVGTIWRS